MGCGCGCSSPAPRLGDAHDASAWRRFGWDSAFRVEVDGVQWDLCGGLDALVPTLLATHALVGRRGLLGLRPRRRWWPGRRSLLADLELIAPCYREGEPWSAGARPPLRASPIVGRCFLVGRWVMLADLDAAWVRPYEVGSAVTPLMRLRPRHIPAATALFAELCGLARRPALPSAVAYRDDQHDGVLY
ncbi:MAG: hypothetical protein U1F43_32475 [Myxococcota bacterium]